MFIILLGFIGLFGTIALSITSTLLAFVILFTSFVNAVGIVFAMSAALCGLVSSTEISSIWVSATGDTVSFFSIFEYPPFIFS